MYQTYFGLAAAPFSIAPDPRYLYMSPRHQEALATLLYGLRTDGGFVLLTGEIGAGKTTICRCLLEQMPKACDVAYLFNPRLTVTELLSSICDEFGIACPEGAPSIKRYVDLLNNYLLEAHAKDRRAVLIIDEAQNLAPEVLEQIRLLTNLETNERKLLQILLLGQPELVAMLARPQLRQLAQRVVARYHLMPLDKAEVASYVRHRLEVAGTCEPLFPDRLWGELYRLSGGVPRVINLLCDRALLGAFVQQKRRVDRATLARAAREVLAPLPPRQQQVRRSALAGASLALGAALAISLYRQQLAEPPGPPAATNGGGAAPMADALPANSAIPTQSAAAFLSLPRDISAGESQHVAFATLFNKWRIPYDPREDPCTQAIAQGLQCRGARGGLQELRALNIPVILHMASPGGHAFDAALTGLGAESARFSFGAQIREVSLDAIAPQWGGEYTMLLRVPHEIDSPLQAGDRGAAAAWLANKLNVRRAVKSEDAVFDDALKDEVRKFQFSHGLAPDGIVGFKTLAHLSVAADPSVPRLAAIGLPARAKQTGRRE